MTENTIMDPHQLPAADTNEQTERSATLPPRNRGQTERHQQGGDVVLNTLTMLQRQQQEQLRLMRQLLLEIEGLKSAQTHQGTTVEKLDRRMKRARLWQLGWLLLRWAVIGTGIGVTIYLIGPERLMALWQRLVWLLT